MIIFDTEREVSIAMTSYYQLTGNKISSEECTEYLKSLIASRAESPDDRVCFIARNSLWHAVNYLMFG